MDNIINDCTVVCDDEFSVKTEQNILSNGNDEEDFASEDGDCSTEDEYDCYDGSLVYIDKDLNHSKGLRRECIQNNSFLARKLAKKSNL